MQFARPEQRIALAPSFGIDSASSSQLKRLSRYLEKFERVSVREEKGARLIKAATGREVEVVCDPTLVLSPEEWRRISNHDLTPKSPYYFAYVLGGKEGEAGSALSSLAEEKELPIVYLSDREKPGEPPAGPAEFISLIDHAEHVVTDSFHAAVFASILQTSLTIVHREGGASMFSRLETLSEILGIEQKIYGSPSFDLSRAGDCEGVQEAIVRERAKFMSYFERCLHA